MQRKEVGIEEARGKLGLLVDEAADGTTDVIFTRHGKPAVRLIPYQEETVPKTWTLEVDATAGALQTWVAEALPGQVQPGVSDGRHASVDTVGDGQAPPEWMAQLARELTDANIWNQIS